MTIQSLKKVEFWTPFSKYLMQTEDATSRSGLVLLKPFQILSPLPFTSIGPFLPLRNGALQV